MLAECMDLLEWSGHDESILPSDENRIARKLYESYNQNQRRGIPKCEIYRGV